MICGKWHTGTKAVKYQSTIREHGEIWESQERRVSKKTVVRVDIMKA